jgi:DNA-binding NarL/FixJ family response regulator
VEDAASTRRLLRAVLESSTTFEVVGEADTGSEALEVIRRLRPEVILLDLSLPDIDGAQLLPRLLDVLPGAKVVVLSNNARSAGPGLIASGATAYIEKGLAPSELLDSLVAALRERATLSPDEPRMGTEGSVALDAPSRAVVADADPLVRREISSMLGDCGLQIVTEVVTTTDVAAAVRSAVETTDRAFVVIGEVPGSARLELIAELAGRFNRSTFVAYVTAADKSEPGDVGGRLSLVVRPDIIGLEHHARQFVGQPAH